MAESLCWSVCTWKNICICLVSVKCKEKDENVYFEVGSAYTSDWEYTPSLFYLSIRCTRYLIFADVFSHISHFLFSTNSDKIFFFFLLILIIIRCSSVENSFIYFQKHCIYGQNYIASSQTKLTFRAYMEVLHCRW